MLPAPSLCSVNTPRNAEFYDGTPILLLSSSLPVLVLPPSSSSVLLSPNPVPPFPSFRCSLLTPLALPHSTSFLLPPPPPPSPPPRLTPVNLPDLSEFFRERRASMRLGDGRSSGGISRRTSTELTSKLDSMSEEKP